MLKENLKDNSGITLIALIITIVIMVILVTATVAILLGQNGIINNTQEAKEKTNIEIEKEELINSAMGAYDGSKREVNYEKLDNMLPQGFTGNNGIYTSKSGNKFKVDKDGKVTYLGKDDGINENNEQDLDLLRDYFLGKIDDTTGERTGRNFADLLVSIEAEDFTEWQFKEVDNIEFDEENIKALGFDESSGDGEYYLGVVIKYNDEMYTLVIEIDSMDCKTLEKKTIRVGEYVEYDNRKWKILYADDIHGIQMVSIEVMEYDGGELSLTEENSPISNWDEIINEVDINRNSTLDKYEKRAYLYNHAVEILNKACESIVTKNENIIDVRCIGSDPINKSKESSTKYSSEELAVRPTNDSLYGPGIFNGRMLNGDMNYESDYSRLFEIDVLDPKYNNDPFWLASRNVRLFGDDVAYCIRMYRWDYGENGQGCDVYDSWLFTVASKVIQPQAGTRTARTKAYLRPVVKLKSDIKFDGGSGSGDTPYIIK